MTCPSKARTLSTSVMIMVCSVRSWTVHTAPGKAVARNSSLSTVPLCIHSGAVPVSLCLQMRVSWSEQLLLQGDTEGSCEQCVKRHYIRWHWRYIAMHTRDRSKAKHPLNYKCFDLHVHRHERGLRHTQRSHMTLTRGKGNCEALQVPIVYLLAPIIPFDLLEGHKIKIM